MIPAVEKYLRQQATHIKRRLSKYDSLAGVRPAELFDIVAESDLYLSKFEGRYRDAFEDAAEAAPGDQARAVAAGAGGQGAAIQADARQIERLKRQIQEAAQYFNATTWATARGRPGGRQAGRRHGRGAGPGPLEAPGRPGREPCRLISRTEMAGSKTGAA
jgi:hypothetical protein